MPLLRCGVERPSAYGFNLGTEQENWRSLTSGWTASYEHGIWFAYVCEIFAMETAWLPVRLSCSRRRTSRFSLKSHCQRDIPLLHGSRRRNWQLIVSLFPVGFMTPRTYGQGSTRAYWNLGSRKSALIQQPMAPTQCVAPRTFGPCNCFWDTPSWKALCVTSALRSKTPWNFQSKRRFERTFRAGDLRQFWLPVTGHSQVTAASPDLLLRPMQSGPSRHQIPHHKADK